MKVFTDLHHADLYFSLHKLFEKRLGWELYRPIGLEWFHNKYWEIGNPYGDLAIQTANQYLNIQHRKWDKCEIEKDGFVEYSYSMHGNHYIKDNIYYVYEPIHKYHQKAITLERFKSMKFDLIMPTFPTHSKCYELLRNKFQPQAKLVAQMGNKGQSTHLKNVLYTVPYSPKASQNALYYHQEIDLSLYPYTQPNPDTRIITSVVNGLLDKPTYLEYKRSMKDIKFNAYGVGCPDGSLFGSKGVGEKMREANIGWHIKPGLGHSSMGWLASGRPLIVKMSRHQGWGKDVNYVFTPGKTCINLEGQGKHETMKLIRKWLEPDMNLAKSQEVLRRFNETINYDKEAEDIKSFLERVLS